MSPAGNGRWGAALALKSGRYTYQYEVDGARRAADPYAREIQWKDRFGRGSGIPDEAFFRVARRGASSAYSSRITGADPS